MKKNIFFLGGTPRSGSTLLCNLLCQNPTVHATATSGIAGMIVSVRDIWQEMDEFKAMKEEETEKKKIQVLRGMLHGFFEDVDRPNICEKSRGWLAHLEMAERILERKPKVIVPVRDLRDVLCSFEKLWRKTKDTRLISQERAHPIDYQTLAGRCAVLSLKGGVVGSCVDRIRDAVARGWRKQMLFVEYEELTKNPSQTMSTIYDFLELPRHAHDFNHVEQVTVENDMVHIFKDLHKIRPVVAEQEPQWPHMMPKELAAAYTPEAHFWRAL